MPRGIKPKLRVSHPGLMPTDAIGDNFIVAEDLNFTKNEWLKKRYGNIVMDDNPRELIARQDVWDKQQGKWIIKFKNGNEAIDKAWKAVLEGIKRGYFYQAKVAYNNDAYPDQAIMIYTYDRDDLDDIIYVHDKIKKLGICTGAISTNIEYKENFETQNHTDGRLYDSNKIEQIKAERPSFIAAFLLNVMANKELHLAAFLVISLAIVATAIGFTIMGAPLVAGAIIASGTVLGLAALGAHGFFCGRETKSLDETPVLESLSR